ncbi:crotonobetainyl-CoA:carnitine CoA-transferase CaiB-like acyl-CoA transferase [Litorimonas taeanensis]|uniref:Crotonobetainyl-CoA:carnitine CoA-transferase CaiB-like acyl-CoA transferase n=1 Tax=Litorimonas taeanensis TaxID=568099 RepID=A0A420WLP7_9PROT|nr:CoA transferase [Litorimonas taeanensis]RKQ71944.1 crotonobetainyl-CoA:carnitine CoA-transferase CaiB-like acyl-CoA transferase [Litorimonas taeanensis]
MAQNLPLKGIRIIAVEQYGAGPYGTQLLADLGAEVIKIENPLTGGDVSRFVSPHLIGEKDSQFFQTFNRNKKSISLDLKSKEGRAAFEALVKTADAVSNNLRGDLPEKLKIDYAALKSVNPKIVCAHLSAYGRGNSREAWPGYDYLMQAEAGFCSVTGEPDGPPVRFGLSMVDFMTGSMFATGLVSAVFGAHRSGEGSDIDVSLFDTALHQLSYPATWYLNSGDITTRQPRGAHPAIVPSQLMEAGDGWIMFCCQTQKFWERLCECLGKTEWVSDPRFVKVEDRRANRDIVQEEVERVLKTNTVSYWMEKFGGYVPAAPVYDIQQALENDYVHEVEMVYEDRHDDMPGQKIKLLSSPYKFNGERLKGGISPELGADTQVLVK